FTDPDKMQSFVRTVQFAQSTGTDINITWQGGTLLPQQFANVLLDLVRNKGITHLRWVTLQNEPNRTRMTMDAYAKQYRDLDTLITQTNISAFQHAWFDILAADLGYLGTSKWDSYYGKYDNGSQAYYVIGGPQSGWPLYPMYNLLQLFTTTVKRGWQVVATDS